MTVNLLCKQCNLDTFCVLRQSFCGNFKLSAEFYDRKYRLLGCMGTLAIDDTDEDDDEDLTVVTLVSDDTYRILD